MIEAYKGKFESLELIGYEKEWLRRVFKFVTLLVYHIARLVLNCQIESFSWLRRSSNR